MRADILFDNVEFEQNSEQKIRVEQGLDNTFRMVLKEVSGSIRWATIGDPILDLRETDDQLSAVIIPTATGFGEIQIQDMDRKVLFWLGVEVFDTGRAEKISITVGTPVIK